MSVNESNVFREIRVRLH